jgi:hypothetical protein
MRGFRFTPGVANLVARVAIQLVLVLIAALFFTLDAVGAPEVTPFGAVTLPWQVLMLAVAAVAVGWSGIQQVRMQIQLDRRAHYAAVASRLSGFHFELSLARRDFETGSTMFAFGRAHGAKESTLELYVARQLGADKEIAGIADALFAFVESDPLLGPAQAAALKTVPITGSGTIALAEAWEGWLERLVERLADEQRSA